ncbi:MAG: hypothetical protein IKJ74_07570 [Clostridia bacterium]|nr:hypothetical protein [Clostridia bacterium]
MLPTLSHELVHQFAKEDVEGYNALRDLVMVSLAENRLKGETVDNREEVIKKLREEIVREEIENIRKNDPKRFEGKTEKTVYAIAEEELVARACEDRLANSRLMKTFIDEMDAKDSRLARAFSNMLSTAVRHLKAQFQRLVDSYKAGSREADIIAKGIDKLDAIQAQFDALLERKNPANAAESDAYVMKMGRGGQQNFEEDKYFARQTDKFYELKEGSYVNVGKIKHRSPLNLIGFPVGSLYFDVSKINKEMKKRKDTIPAEKMKKIPNVLDILS